MIWSIAPDRSWGYFNRGAVYIGVRAARARRRCERAGAGAGRGGRARGAALRRRGLGAAREGVPVAVPGRRAGRAAAEPDRVLERARSRVRDGAAARAVGATRRSWRRELRAAGACCSIFAVIALVLTFSRAGIVVAVVARAAVARARAGRRLESFGALVVSGVVPAAAVAGWATTRSGSSTTGSRSRPRPTAGWFALVVLLVAVVVVAVALWADGATGGSTTRRLGGCGRGGSGSAWARSWWRVCRRVSARERRAERVAARVPRRRRGLELVAAGHAQLEQPLGVVEGGLAVFESKPAGGKGAATFAIARLRVRKGASITNEPHNIALQALAETGIVGFLLGVGAVVAALLAIARAVLRLRDEERAAAVAIAIAIPALRAARACGHRLGLRRGLRARVHRRWARDRDRRARCEERVRSGPFAGGGLAVAAVCSRASTRWRRRGWRRTGRRRLHGALRRAIPLRGPRPRGTRRRLQPPVRAADLGAREAYAAVRDERRRCDSTERATRLQPENPDTWVAPRPLRALLR